MPASYLYQDQFIQTYKRLRDRIIKEILDLNYFQSLSEAAYRKAVKRYSTSLPTLSPVDSEIIETLYHEGVYITSLENLEVSSTPLLTNACQNLLPKLLAVSPKSEKQFSIHASSSQLMEYPEIFNWGLEEKFLNIIENYLSLPVAFHGLYFRRDLANSVERNSRLWHLDREDRRMLKIIIYLNDVSEEGGAFQYIPRSLTAKAFKSLKYDYGNKTDKYINDKTMEDVIPKSQWKSCVGASGTVVFADTASIFHRGKVPVSSERFSLFFDYTSRRPKRPNYCNTRFSVNELTTLSQKLSKRQKECIWGNHKLLFGLNSFV
ncbi:MAG: hypothetical protein QNJ46_05250 [Leptolyngbyaceae cyanobacterium MO_188.B28]|nr:hypothetical protein [Leptolyngbyaceae cyanobacterium MO_188.B28]